MLTYMHMLLLVLAGSALSVVLKLKTNWELRSSSWVMEKLSSLTALMDQNGSFAQPAKCPIISPVSPPIQSNRLNLKAGHLSAPLISAMPGHIKWVTHTKKTRSANQCNVVKLPPIISWHRSIFNSTNLPYPWALRAEGLISSPLSLTLEPSTHDHHLPFYLFPLNQKETNVELCHQLLLSGETQYQSKPELLPG